MSDITPEQVRAFYAHMTQRFAATVKPKATAIEMQAAAQALGVLKAFMQVPDPETFMRHYVTTLGSTVYAPFEPGVAQEAGNWHLWNQISVLTHELVHVEQRRRAATFAHELDYLTSSGRRATIEAEAYRANLELHFWRYGVIDNQPSEYAEYLRAYGCTDQDIAVVRSYLRASAPTIRKGGRIGHVAKVAIDWLEANAPQIKV